MATNKVPNIDLRGLGEIKIYVNQNKNKLAVNLLNNVPKLLLQGYSIGANRFADRLYRIVTTCLKKGTPPKGVSWKPHAESTTKTLGSHPIMYLSGFYARYIRINTRKNGIVYVGLPQGLRRPSGLKGSSKRTMAQIARMLEYGSGDGDLPARPLWRPAYEQAGGKERLKKEVVNGLREAINRYTSFYGSVVYNLSMGDKTKLTIK